MFVYTFRKYKLVLLLQKRRFPIPSEMHNKIIEFERLIIYEMQENSDDLDCIGDMEERLTFFDMLVDMLIAK